MKWPKGLPNKGVCIIIQAAEVLNQAVLVNMTVTQHSIDANLPNEAMTEMQ